MQVRGRTIPDWVLVPGHVRARQPETRRQTVIRWVVLFGTPLLVLGVNDGKAGVIWIGAALWMAAAVLVVVEVRDRRRRRDEQHLT